MTLIRRTVGEFAENCYLYVDRATNLSVMIDPGAEPATLIEMVRESESRLSAIWLTHAHLDHIGALNGVLARYPVDVFLHPLDRPWYERLSAEAAMMYGVPWKQPTACTKAIVDGDMLSCGDAQFSVMHVPGHAPGHVAFISGMTAISGDLLFAGSIGRTDLPLCNAHDMEASLIRFAALDASTMVYPGHGPPTSVGDEIEENAFLNGQARVIKR